MGMGREDEDGDTSVDP
jgi:hypothetical protein